MRFAWLLAAGLWCLSRIVSAQIIQIETNEQLESLIRDGVAVVDIRTPEEWKATGVLPESKLLTFFDLNGNYNLRQWLPAFTEIAKPQDKVALICAVGNRSHAVSQFLHQQFGYAQIYNVTRGIDHWISSGNSVQPWP